MANSPDKISATARYARISPTKINGILKKIRGKGYKEALAILKYLPQKAGVLIWQTLYSAASNAVNRFELNKENLVIVEAYANLGPTLKRMQPRAKGRAFKIKKRISHLTIRVANKLNI